MKVSEFIGTAIWYGILIALVVLVITVVCGECGTLTTYRFVAPGLGGMVSNYDIDALNLSESYLLLNADPYSTIGRFKKRTGLKGYALSNSNNIGFYGAFGYYNPLTGDKLIIGITDHATYDFGQFVVSGTFGTLCSNSVSGTIFPYADAYHDFTPYKDVVVCADGKSIPSIFTTSQGFLYTLSKPDTFGYDPHLISMGLEAPGQLRVGLTGTSGGDLEGRYIYAVAFISDSVLGIESRPVTAKNENVYITNLPMDSGIYVFRKSGQEDNLWYLVYTDTITTAGFYLIDSGQAPSLDTAYMSVVRWWTGGDTTTLFDTVPTPALNGYSMFAGRVRIQCCIDPIEPYDPHGNAYDSLGYRRTWGWRNCEKYGCTHWLVNTPINASTDIDSFVVDTVGLPFTFKTTGCAPGQFVSIDTAVIIDTLHATHPDSLYYLAYSYYDPVTGIESPLGPLLACSLTTGTWTTDTLMMKQYVFDNFDTTLNPSHIRIYQTVTKTELPGAGDSMVLYGILELRALEGGVTVGNWRDDSVVVGLDTSYMTGIQYYTHQMLRNDLGGVKILPPYNYDCRIPFSDIEYMAGQFWGIGDPDCPNRVYFSEYDWPGMNIFSWYPLDFVQIQEIGNDELVAIERAEGFGADALYILAHNSTWLMSTNGDYQAISTRIGAASRESVVKYDETIYFISPGMRIYALFGAQLTEISKPVESEVENLFVTLDWSGLSTDFHCRGHKWGDFVRWFNDSTGVGLAFNTKEEYRSWSLVQYGTPNLFYVPRHSFFYDTVSAGSEKIPLAPSSELLYSDTVLSGATGRFKTQSTLSYDGTIGTGISSILSTYQTGFYGMPSRFSQIQEIELLIEAVDSGYLHYTIYDEHLDSVSADSFYFNDATGSKTIRLHPPYNMGERLSAKLFTLRDSFYVTEPVAQWKYYKSDIELLDVAVKIRDMGAVRVQ